MDDIHSALDVFETTASQLGLHVSWQKTKIQNLGAGVLIISQPCLPVCGHSLEEVTEFTYLGSVQSATGRCQPDIVRRIGIASTAMHSMNKVWRQTRLQLQTKLRSYQTCILSMLLYGSETWTLLQEDLRKLEVFHMRFQRMIFGIRWHDFVRNTEVVDRTGLPSVWDVIAGRRNSLFSHVVRLDDHTSAHRALSQVAAARIGSRFGPGWRRLPGRPRHSWIQQIGDGTPFSIRAEWSKAHRRGHSELTQRTSAVYAIWWWWRWWCHSKLLQGHMYSEFLGWLRTACFDRVINKWEINYCVPACQGWKTALRIIIVTFDIARCSDRNTVCWKDLTLCL